MQRRVCINLCQASATFPVAQATVHRSSHFAYLISSRIKASPCVIQAQGNHLICRALQDRGVACWKQRRRVLIGMPRMPEIRCSASGAAMGKGCQPVIVKLCSAARQYFAAGKTPQKREIQEMCNLLNGVPLHELGVKLPTPSTSEKSEKPPEWAPAITYLHILECAEFTVGIFCLPKHAVIPLHNHPGMTVFSRLLYGDIHIKSYDTLKEADAEPLPPSQLKAVPVGDFVLKANSPATVLYPHSGGNIHEFTALSDCAVLDVLAPPYNQSEGRDCTYYREINSSRARHTNGEQPWSVLEEFEPPVDFVVVRGDYKGIDVEEVWTADLKEHDTGEVSGGSSNASDGSSEHLERLSIGPD